MPKNLSKYSKLLVISDTGMYLKDGKVYAFGPVVKELEEILSLFDTITWIGFNQPEHKDNLSYIEIESNRVKIIKLNRFRWNYII